MLFNKTKYHTLSPSCFSSEKNNLVPPLPPHSAELKGRSSNAPFRFLLKYVLNCAQNVLNGRHFALNLPDAVLKLPHTGQNLRDSNLNLVHLTLNLKDSILNLPESVLNLPNSVLNFRNSALNFQNSNGKSRHLAYVQPIMKVFENQNHNIN